MTVIRAYGMVWDCQPHGGPPHVADNEPRGPRFYDPTRNIFSIRLAGVRGRSMTLSFGGGGWFG